MALAREAWTNALNPQLFNSQVGVYFRGGLFPWGFYLWGFISVGVYFLSKMKWEFFPRVSFRNQYETYMNHQWYSMIPRISYMIHVRVSKDEIKRWKSV